MQLLVWYCCGQAFKLADRLHQILSMHINKHIPFGWVFLACCLVSRLSMLKRGFCLPREWLKCRKRHARRKYLYRACCPINFARHVCYQKRSIGEPSKSATTNCHAVPTRPFVTSERPLFFKCEACVRREVFRHWGEGDIIHAQSPSGPGDDAVHAPVEGHIVRRRPYADRLCASGRS